MEQVTNNYFYGRPGMQRRQKPQPIDWKAWFEKLKQHRKSFFISLPLTFVLACIIMLSIPNYYDVQVKLAPELGSSSSKMGGLSSLMSSSGLGGSAASDGSDAVTPLSYPDLMNSKTFLVSLFDVKVQDEDTTFNTTYYEYLDKYQKAPWWSEAAKSVGEAIASLLPAQEKEKAGPANPFRLTREQDEVTKMIGKNIVCDVDKKTAIITINVTDQDPVICATMADSACVHLQNFITDYRTKKSRQELQNIQVQVDKTRRAYEIAKDKLGAFNNSNWAIVNEDQKLQQQFLQNDMNLKYQTYSQFTNQLIAARTKLEASRPVYTVLDGASVPVKKSGPKRAISVLMICFLVFFVQSAWILRKELKEQFAPKPAPAEPTAKV